MAAEASCGVHHCLDLNVILASLIFVEKRAALCLNENASHEASSCLHINWARFFKVTDLFIITNSLRISISSRILWMVPFWFLSFWWNNYTNIRHRGEISWIILIASLNLIQFVKSLLDVRCNRHRSKVIARARASEISSSSLFVAILFAHNFPNAIGMVSHGGVSALH